MIYTAALYFIFAAFAVGCLLFLKLYVPETRGKSPEELNGLQSSDNHIENPLLDGGSDNKTSMHGLLQGI